MMSYGDRNGLVAQLIYEDGENGRLTVDKEIFNYFYFNRIMLELRYEIMTNIMLIFIALLIIFLTYIRRKRVSKSIEAGRSRVGPKAPIKTGKG